MQTHSDQPVGVMTCPDSAEWRWPEESKKQWVEVTDESDEYVAFYNRWYPSTRPKFPTKLPYKLSLELPTQSTTGTILVTEAYDNMYRRLLRLRETDRVETRVKGAVVTGQPGIGAPLTRSPPHTSTH